MIAVLLAIVVAQASNPPPSLSAIWAAEIRSAPASTFSQYCASPDVAVRQRAALALGRLRDPKALPLLESLVQDSSVSVRAAAAFSLGQTPNSRETILRVLALENEPLPRQRLVAALGFQATDEDISGFLSLLQESSPIAREAAIGLGRLKISGSSNLDTLEVTTALSEALTGFIPTTRTAVAFALARIKPTTLAASSWQALSKSAHQDRDPHVRARLTRALAPSAQQHAEAFFARQSQDSEAVVRVAAARSVADLTLEDPIQALTSMLGDTSWAVRLTVAEELATLEGVPNEFLKPLVEPTEEPAVIAAVLTKLLLQDETQQPRAWLAEHQPLVVRQAAVAALTEQSQLLRIATEEATPSLRTAAALRLAELSPNPSSLRALLADQDSVVAGIALNHIAEHPESLKLSEVLQSLNERTEPDVALEFLALIEGLPNKKRAGAQASVGALRLHPDLAVRSAAERLASEMDLPPAPPGAFYSPPPPLASISRIRGARVITNVGELRLELYPDMAPMAVHRFATLAEDGFYDDLLFHRVVPNFVLQAGCPRSDGWGGPKRLLPAEPSWLPYKAGVLGMADAGHDTAGSQWFITLSEQPHLEGRYTAFGALTLQNGVSKRIPPGTRIVDVIIERTSETGGEKTTPTGEP